MNEEEAATRFIESGFAYVTQGVNSLRIRLCSLTENEAEGLKRQHGGGSASLWEPTQTWQWEAQGRAANNFLLAIRLWVELKPVRREDTP